MAEHRLPLLAPSTALGALRAVEVDGRTVTSIRRGQQRALGALGRPRGAGEVVRVATEDGRLVAIAAATPDGAGWQLARVMVGGGDDEGIE
jgi:hypothetical protein